MPLEIQCSNRRTQLRLTTVSGVTRLKARPTLSGRHHLAIKRLRIAIMEVEPQLSQASAHITRTVAGQCTSRLRRWLRRVEVYTSQRSNIKNRTIAVCLQLLPEIVAHRKPKMRPRALKYSERASQRRTSKQTCPRPQRRCHS